MEIATVLAIVTAVGLMIRLGMQRQQLKLDKQNNELLQKIWSRISGAE
jgi:hypothetical protein